jgi:hypothetical protein
MENNPYAAPRAAVQDVGPERGRPVLVWVITIFMGLGIVSSVVSTLLALNGTPIGGDAVIAYLKSVGIGTFDHLWGLVATAISGFAFIDLFRLKRRALPVLAALFAAGLVYVGMKLALNPAYRTLFDNPGGTWSLYGGWALNLAIIGYVWWLRAKGTLK